MKTCSSDFTQKESIQDIDQFLANKLESKRALAVKMYLQGYVIPLIMSLLDVSEPFIRKWVQQYKKYGIDSLQLQYKGSQGFLSPEEHRQVITFLEEKDYYSLEELQAYLLKTYHVQYKSKQSYYDLLHKAKLSWKKTEKVHPDKDETKVAERREAIKKNLSPGKRRFCRENLSSC
jgi:putative transposase